MESKIEYKRAEDIEAMTKALSGRTVLTSSSRRFLACAMINGTHVHPKNDLGNRY
jgi:hypothetical protein